MDESRYLKLADVAFRRIEDAFESVDADDVDLERAGDVLTLHFRSGARCVINTQRPCGRFSRQRAPGISHDESTSLARRSRRRAGALHRGRARRRDADRGAKTPSRRLWVRAGAGSSSPRRNPVAPPGSNRPAPIAGFFAPLEVAGGASGPRRPRRRLVPPQGRVVPTRRRGASSPTHGRGNGPKERSCRNGDCARGPLPRWPLRRPSVEPSSRRFSR